MLDRKARRSSIDTGLLIYTKIAKVLGRNAHVYTYDNIRFKYGYDDPRTFKKFWNLIDDGVVMPEGLPMDILDRSEYCDAVIDVGAHYGIYSVILGKLNPGAQLYAYEPAPEPMAWLKRNLALNSLCSEAKVSDNIVSGRSGNGVPFYVDGQEGSQRHSTTDKEGFERTIRQTISLSDVFKMDSIASPFLKIDAEGEEGRIVDDITEQSETDSLCGIIEFHPEKYEEYTQEEIIEKLRDSGFTVDFVCESALDYDYNRPIYHFHNGPSEHPSNEC